MQKASFLSMRIINVRILFSNIKLNARIPYKVAGFSLCIYTSVNSKNEIYIYLSPVKRKPAFWVSDQVRLKQVWNCGHLTT